MVSQQLERSSVLQRDSGFTGREICCLIQRDSGRDSGFTRRERCCLIQRDSGFLTTRELMGNVKGLWFHSDSGDVE